MKFYVSGFLLRADDKFGKPRGVNADSCSVFLFYITLTVR